MATIKRAGNNPALESVIPTPDKRRVFLTYWASPEALAAHATTIKTNDCWSKSAWTNGEKFTGTKDMASAVAMCRNGWSEGATRAARLRDKINAANPMGPRVVKWDVAGSVASVPRALAGNPLNMRRIDSTRLRRKPVLTLLSDMSCNGGVAADAITNRAAVVAAIIDSIESAGFACEVVAFNCSSESSIAQVTAATVKESGAPADIGRLAFSLGHASFFRRISWAAFTCDSFTKDLGVGLGHATALDQDEANQRGVYILPSAGANESVFATEDNAATRGLDFLIAALRKQDCPAFPKLVENDNAA
jgi:hypothetical protein